MLIVHCSLLTAHCSLLTAHCSLLTAHCSLLTLQCSNMLGGNMTRTFKVEPKFDWFKKLYRFNWVMGQKNRERSKYYWKIKL